MKLLLLFLHCASAFRLPAHPMGVPALRVAAPASGLAVLRTESPPQMGLAQIAAGANMAVFGIYGLALVFKPATMIVNIMRSAEPVWQFEDITYALAQYLGAMYISQAVRLYRALAGITALGSALSGVGTVQLCLCLTSLARVFWPGGNLVRDAVTLSLPMGQGLMSWLAFAGASSL